MINLTESEMIMLVSVLILVDAAVDETQEKLSVELNSIIDKTMIELGGVDHEKQNL